MTYGVVKVGIKRGGNLVREVGVLLRVVLHAKLASHLRHNAKLLEIHERRHQRAVVVVFVRAAALNATRTQKDLDVGKRVRAGALRTSDRPTA